MTVRDSYFTVMPLTLENTQLPPASREMTYEYDLEYTLIVLLL